MEPSKRFRERKHRPFLYGTAIGALFLFAFLVSSGAEEQSPAVFPLASAGSVGEAWASRVALAAPPETLLVGGVSLQAMTPPHTVSSRVLGAQLGYQEAPEPEVSRYVAQEGDTVASLAEEFGISQETIWSVNNLTGPLAPGQELLMLPVSGALHLVRPYDTLSEIASWYGADMEEITDFNELESPQHIMAGDLLIIPGGAAPSSLPVGRLTPLANTYFIYPVPAPHRITQGLHPFNAIDFSNGKCGDPIYAAAGGTVQRTGYDSIAGYYVRVLHPNGVVTFYGHLASVAQRAGAKVFQGQILGYMGYSGYTIPAGPAGCHLHFEVRGARNSFVPQ
ncbi:peptidoglycan DD-metalloendopeptidase family protein [Patescibacteria group bacterium]|nr:peptidoglycan DD-metalloendopeptidase family protein [Patescibacteria group bacterium]